MRVIGETFPVYSRSLPPSWPGIAPSELERQVDRATIGQQQVFFDGNGRERVRGRLIDEAQMRVRFNETGHQRRTAAVDVVNPRCGGELSGGTNSRDAVALDLHICEIRHGAGAIEH